MNQFCIKFIGFNLVKKKILIKATVAQIKRILKLRQ